MADESFQERTEKATNRRRQKVREEGRVLKSQEVNAAAMLIFGFLTLYALGPYMAAQAQMLMRYTMANAATIAASDPTFATVFSQYVIRFFTIMAPVLTVVVIVALVANVVQVGFRITPKSLEPKFEKLDLVKGFKRLFSARSVVQLGRDLIKLTIVGIVAYKAIDGEFESFFLLPDMTVAQLASAMGKLAIMLGLKVGGIMVVIAVLDYAYQKYEFEKSIRMSKQELKEEHKETEGSPQLKSRVRQIQRQMARQRMMRTVPQADVVVTNPTHLAVALKYDPEEMSAPMVVAKGARLVAQRIKEIARQHNIPVIEDKPLARSLFKLCEIGEVVPEKLFKAVAELLAYVYRLKKKVVR
ncbi:MAG TPA: flagellar biosynthesis protein FlhB [candidate division Zixibacteria bacterium]|nr:flagellar biosynthesis protein FlhB [candidate division Zixibacteria bacterium]